MMKKKNQAYQPIRMNNFMSMGPYHGPPPPESMGMNPQMRPMPMMQPGMMQPGVMPGMMPPMGNMMGMQGPPSHPSMGGNRNIPKPMPQTRNAW